MDEDQQEIAFPLFPALESKPKLDLKPEVQQYLDTFLNREDFLSNYGGGPMYIPPALDSAYKAKLDKFTKDIDRLLEGVQERAGAAIGPLQELIQSVNEDQRPLVALATLASGQAICATSYIRRLLTLKKVWGEESLGSSKEAIKLGGDRGIFAGSDTLFAGEKFDELAKDLGKTAKAPNSRQSRGEKEMKVSGDTITVECAIDELGKRPTMLLGLVWIWATLIGMVCCLSSYLGVFAGFIPSDENKILCVSARCNLLYEQAQQQEQEESFHNIENICKSNLTYGEDFTWNISRSSFTVDLNLFCSSSSLSLYHSIYFVGTIIGVCIGSILYERMGRRRTAVFGSCLITVSTLCATFATSYTVLLVLRVLQGLGDQLAFLGAYIWLFEMTPARYRSFYNSWIANTWVLGYPTLVCISYYIHNWRYICVAVGLVQGFCQIPLLICPDSPRYLVSIGKSRQASNILQKWAKLTNSDISFEELKLTEGTEIEKAEVLNVKMSVFEQLLEFKKYPAMLIETACASWAFMVSGLLFYGLAYGWDRFGDSLYVTYLYVAVGELIANTSVELVLKVIGRKVALISYFTGASICFFLGTINHEISPHWTVERVMSMLASFFATSICCLVILYTGELAPTTHRGMISSGGLLFARVSGFFGPLLSAAELTSGERLSLFGALAASSALTSLLLPETREQEIPATARDVKERRRRQKVLFTEARL